jgi:hypothetical protein
MTFTVAPFFGSDIGDGLSEIPTMTPDVLSIVLAFPVRLVFGFCQDDGSTLSGMLGVSLSIFDPNLNDMGTIGRCISFSNGEAPCAGLHLDTVIRDTEADRETESF